MGVKVSNEFGLPDINWRPNHYENKWPDVRSWNVKQVKKLWDEDPNRVQVINDSRLEATALVMMRKDKYEAIKNLIDDLHNGQAGISADIQMAAEQVTLIEDSILPSGDSLAMARALNVLKGILERSSGNLMADPTPLPLSQPTAEELEGFDPHEEL